MPRQRITRGLVMTTAVASALTLAGCAKMDAALGQQYVIVQFAPYTTLATARQVTAACSRIPNVHLQPVKPTTPDANIVDSATFNATSATDADLARLQVCLQRFRAVQGLTTQEPGGS